MQRTLLVTLEISSADPSSIDGYAAQAEEALREDGLPVVSVKPWNAPQPDEFDMPPGLPLSGERLF